MFVFDTPSIVYSHPWNMPLRDRLRTLLKGRQRVAYVYENPDTTTFRYRVYNMVQALGVSGTDISATFFSYHELDTLFDFVDSVDVLVICRSRYDSNLNRLVTKAQSKRKRIFFDIDDLVFDSQYIHLILHTLAQDVNHPKAWDSWFAYVGRIGASLKLCDRVITTNEYLAAQVKAFADKPVSIIPNFMNREQMEISQCIFREKAKRGFARNSQIHLGYFSGTPTHNKDFEVIIDALIELLDSDPRTRIKVVGFLDQHGLMQKHGRRIEFRPLCNFLNLQREIGQVEVNLIPLQENVFTNCKSELKYFEAAVVGTLSVATPVYTYASAIHDGKNGFLARSFEWYEKIETIVNTLGSYPIMAKNAFADCESKYAWYHQTGLIKRILFS